MGMYRSIKMILPSGTIFKGKLVAKQIEKGLYVIENTYTGKYNLFEPSPLFLKEKEKKMT